MAVLATASLAAALACGMAIGCGGDNSTTNNQDGGGDVYVPPTPEGGPMEASPLDTGTKMDVTPPMDVVTPPPDSGDGGTMLPDCPLPTITPNGGMIQQNSTITIAATGAMASGAILYTVNGGFPTKGGAGTLTLGGTGGTVQITAVGNVVVDAISISSAATPTCRDSALASATFIVSTLMQPDAGDSGTIGTVPGAPGFTPTTTTQNNDFSVALSGAAGATICYTTDGTTPGCTKGTCAAGSTTYNGTGVTISPTITNATTGKVTITALACNASGNSTSVPQTYTLQVAPPVSLMPDNSAPLAYKNTAGVNTTSYTPTISDTTVGASARYYTGTNTPDCATGLGTALTLPYLLGSGSLGAITQNTLIQIVGCKPGYAASTVTPIQYWVGLNKPTFPFPGGTTYNNVPVSAVVSDSANAGSSDWLCWTNDNSTPTCDTANAGCTHGTNAGPSSAQTMPPQVTATGQQINVVACSPTDSTKNSGFQNSVAPDSSGVYTLSLLPVSFTPPGAGVASYTFVTADGTSRMVAVAPGGGASKTPDWICVGQSNTTVDCTCNTATGHGTVLVGTGANIPVSPNQTWVGYACSMDTTVITNSAATNASYQPVGTASAPGITPASGNYMAQQTITLTNNGTGAIAQFLCATTNGTTPAPAAGCTSNGATVCSASTVVAGTGTFALPAQIETNNQTVKAVGCNATQSTSSAASTNTYTFQLATPSVTGGTTTGDLTAGGAVSGNQSITIATTSDFTGETFNWSDDNSPVDCTTAQNTTAGPSFVYVVPTTAASRTLHIVACGTAQNPSTAITVPLTVSTATPVIHDVVAGNPTGSLTWENSFSVHLTSSTPGANICYTVSPGPAPTCSAGACATGTPFTADIPVTATGQVVTAVACTATLPSNGSATATYTLNVSPYTIASNAMCPATFTITPTVGSIGGATPTANLCYSTTASFTYCGAQGGTGEPATVTCGAFAPAATAVVPTFASAGDIWVTTCRTGFNGDTGSMHAAAVPADNVTSITVNGTKETNEWPGTSALAGTGGVTGYYATDGTTLFFAASGYTAAAGTWVVVYLGDGTTGDTTGPGPLSPTAPGFGAKWAFAWQTNNMPAAPTAYSWSSGGGWVAAAGITVTSSFTNFAEFSVPLSALGTPTTVNVSGQIVTAPGTAGGAVTGSWPTVAGVAGHFVSDLLTSCVTPNLEIQ